MSNRFELIDPGGGRIRDRTPPDPRDLVTIRTGRRRVPLHRNAAQAYERMVAAARAAGIGGALLSVASGYRDPAIQRGLWQRALQRYGDPQIARRWVAPPGRSAHQTGRALDLNLGVPIGSRFAAQQRQTEAFRWLQRNARNYGFYPYEREPWHWEYNPLGATWTTGRRIDRERERIRGTQAALLRPDVSRDLTPTQRIIQRFRVPPGRVPLPGGPQRYYREGGNYFPLHYDYNTGSYYMGLSYTRNPKRPFTLVQNPFGPPVR